MKQLILTYILLSISTILNAAISSDIDLALQMLANFTPYLYKQYQPITDTNSKGEALATFNGENNFGNNEQGVRHNADLSMICAFLCKYGKGHVTLPASISWDKLKEMARTTLTYSYSTHKSTRLYPCKNNEYWGSVSTNDHTWESSLWAMSVAYSAFFQWDTLSEEQRTQIYTLLKAECNYELEREIPTGFYGDTKAEENGWECDVLAVTLGLFPNDPLADKWFQQLRKFAINSYSHSSDKLNKAIVDPEYNMETVADLYKGDNLYTDYTLQNHNYFHTSYQNVVVQELGEAALAMTLFQKELYGNEYWHTNSLIHNVSNVMQQVIYHLALADGELAMPNGNDWSLFLYDQITSYSTAACFLQDADALMLEQQALQQILKRQKTTSDGSWLLHADVGARRMGVEAHRIMMTWLMHHILPTENIKPTLWNDFSKKYAKTTYFPCQDIITASSNQRFTCFSWSNGLKSYTGYFAPVSKTYNNIIVPYRANNTGNFIGWYEVKDKKTNAEDKFHEINYSESNSYIISGTLETNEHTLQNNYLLFSTSNNLVLYFDVTKALENCTILKERGGLLAISTDPFTHNERTLYYKNLDHVKCDGEHLQCIQTDWLNIDNCIGIFANCSSRSNNLMAFGDKQNNNSILTSKFYASYSDIPHAVKKGDIVNTRCFAYYSNISSEETKKLNDKSKSVTGLSENWEGRQITDTDGSNYIVLYNFTEKNDSNPNISYIRNKIKPRLILVVTLKANKFTVTTIQ